MLDCCHSFSRGSSWPRGHTQVSCMGRRVRSHWATREARKRWQTASNDRLPRSAARCCGSMHSRPNPVAGSEAVSGKASRTLQSEQGAGRQGQTLVTGSTDTKARAQRGQRSGGSGACRPQHCLGPPDLAPRAGGSHKRVVSRGVMKSATRHPHPRPPGNSPLSPCNVLLQNNLFLIH